MKKFKLKTGDNVVVIAGEHKGEEGQIIEILTAKDKAVVKGVNMISKHTKPSANNPQGGIVKKEAPIHISNLMLLENGKPVRVGFRTKDGKKERYSKRTNEAI